MTWTLIIVVYGSGAVKVPAITSISFGAESTCEAARYTINKEMPNTQAVCVALKKEGSTNGSN